MVLVSMSMSASFRAVASLTARYVGILLAVRHEVRLPEPSLGRGAVGPRQQAGEGWQVALDVVDPWADDGGEEFQAIEGEPAPWLLGEGKSPRSAG